MHGADIRKEVCGFVVGLPRSPHSFVRPQGAHSFIPTGFEAAAARSGGPGRPLGRRESALPWTGASTVASCFRLGMIACAMALAAPLVIPAHGNETCIYLSKFAAKLPELRLGASLETAFRPHDWHCRDAVHVANARAFVYRSDAIRCVAATSSRAMHFATVSPLTLQSAGLFSFYC